MFIFPSRPRRSISFRIESFWSGVGLTLVPITPYSSCARNKRAPHPAPTSTSVSPGFSRNFLSFTLKKLRLKPGETLVDVGAGWGALLFRAHELYGVIGTNVSPTPDQNDSMRKEIERRGLEGKMNIKEIDFREDTEVYDKYVSLGVYEHAGYNQLEAWIEAMSRSLKDGGIGVLHFIGN